MNKEKNLTDQRASLRVDTSEIQQYPSCDVPSRTTEGPRTMGHSSGNSQLLMSLALVTVGTGLFLGGLGTKHWLHYTSPDHANTTMSCGLWETCVEERDASASQSSGGCSGIKPGSAKGEGNESGFRTLCHRQASSRNTYERKKGELIKPDNANLRERLNLSNVRWTRWLCHDAYHWATRGVMVSASAFLACPPMLECGFESRLGLEFSGFSMWHFLKLVVRSFLWVLRFPPLLHLLMVSD